MKGRLINFRVIFYPFLAFLLGIIAARPLYCGNLEYIVVSILLLAAVAGFFIYKKMYKALAIIFAFFFIGNGFYFIGEASYNVKNYQGQVAVYGRISDDIDKNSYSTVVILDDVSINGEDAGNIRLEINNIYQNTLKIGDYVTFEGEVDKCNPFTLGSFNSKDYRSGVKYNTSVKYDNIVFSKGYQYIDETVRLDIKELIYSNMSEDNAAIAYAVMFGDKSGLDSEIYNAYQSSGIIHVLTVSGLHVGFLVSLFYGLMRKFGVNNIANLCISSVVIFFYAFLCNFSPSVVRAGVMAICMMSARALHRKYDSLNALGLAGFILCLFKPLTALDTGFLMSFFCVFGIVMINPTLTAFFEKFMPNKIASLLSLSTSAQLGILPFLAYMGGSINLLSFIVNIIIVPLFSILYPFLFLVCMLGTFMPFLGAALKAVDFVFVIINKIAIFFGHAGMTIPLSKLGFAVIIIFFFLLFIFSRYIMLKTVKKFAIFSGSFMVLVFALCCYAFPTNFSTTSVSCLNYYGYNSVILTSRNGETAVIGNSGLLSRYQANYNVGDYDIFLSFDHVADEEVSDLAELGFVRFVSCRSKNDESGGITEIAEFGEDYSFKDFKFNYLDYNGEAIGLLIIFDNQKIFIANESNLDYTLYIDKINACNPEIVIAGDNFDLAKENTFTCITYDEVEGCEFSLECDGNFQLSHNKNAWVKRSLD